MKCSTCHMTYYQHRTHKSSHAFQGFVTWNEIDRVEALLP